MSARRLLLAIEASNPSLSAGDEGSIAVCDLNGDVLAFERLRPGSRHDDALVRTIDDACRAAGGKPGDVARVAVSAGPGGYTGLRIAMTTAKMLGESLGAELVPVPTARVAAFGFVEDDPASAQGGFVVTLASKRDTAWAQVFQGTETTSSGELLDASGLAALLRTTGARTLLADEHLPASMREEAARAGVRVASPRLDAVLCARASLGLPVVAVDALAPIYPREPEAVRKWRDEGR